MTYINRNHIAYLACNGKEAHIVMSDSRRLIVRGSAAALERIQNDLSGDNDFLALEDDLEIENSFDQRDR